MCLFLAVITFVYALTAAVCGFRYERIATVQRALIRSLRRDLDGAEAALKTSIGQRLAATVVSDAETTGRYVRKAA